MRRILAALLLAAGITAGCDLDPTVPGTTPAPGEARLSKKKSKTSTTPHTLQFSTDITSEPIPNVMLDPNSPLTNVAHSTTPITLPDVLELLGCGAEGGNWTPYAGNWTGYLALTGDGSTATLNFTAYAADGTPFWLSVDGAATTQKVGTATVLTFTDVTAMAKLDQEPLVIIFPCVTFSITATPQ
jgi:hypothetical protein